MQTKRERDKGGKEKKEIASIFQSKTDKIREEYDIITLLR
jgi:hypothetical protein